MFSDVYLGEYKLSTVPYPDAIAEPYRTWFRTPIAIGPNVAETPHHSARVIGTELTRTVRMTSAISAMPTKTRFGRVMTASVVATPDVAKESRVGVKARITAPSHHAVTGTS